VTVWFAIAAMAAVAAAILLLPLVRKARLVKERPQFDLAVYRDQLAEVERDEARGTLNVSEAASARIEIERRILSVEEARKSTGEASKAARTAIIIAAIAGPAVATLIYLNLGTPSMPGYPFASREHNEEAPQMAGMDMSKIGAMVEKLAARMKSEPDNLKGWTMLGRSYAMLQRYDEAANAFAHASTLDSHDASLPSSEGEALVMASGGMVTPKARDAFEAALAIDSKDPRARFYLGLASAQAGELRAALATWEALAADAPKDAPWLESLQKEIAKLRESIEAGGKNSPEKASSDNKAPSDKGPAPELKPAPDKAGDKQAPTAGDPEKTTIDK
jgi:cytochrome c-type biogenesis protein CcmH